MPVIRIVRFNPSSRLCIRLGKLPASHSNEHVYFNTSSQSRTQELKPSLQCPSSKSPNDAKALSRLEELNRRVAVALLILSLWE
jgi:hypothetical protein